jgi:hypothetical protein
MIFTIDGFDIVPFIAENGIDWTPNGIDGPDAGRVLSADMERDLLCYKAEGQISCVWMTKDQAYQLYSHILPEFVTIVTDTIPWIYGTVTKRMYSNAAASTLLEEYTDGTKIYGDLSFPLIEK